MLCLAQLRTAEVAFEFAAFGGTVGFAVAVLIAERSPVIILVFLLFTSVDFEAYTAVSSYVRHGRAWMVLFTPQLRLTGLRVIIRLGLID
jgi:hypothetical protein